MPSTVVHVALACLVATALLAEHFDAKAVLVVAAATVFVDLDVFVGLVLPGTHRAAFHTLVLPALVGGVLYLDLRAREWARVQSLARTLPFAGDRSLVRERSWVRSRWGARGVRVAWVGVVAVTFAGIGLDLFFNGVNLFYPIHDRFYDLSGKILYSTQRGFVQTLVDPNFDALFGQAEQRATSPATTENTHYSTGVDPERGAESKSVERVFPVATTGERALLALTGYTVVGLRLWQER